MRLEYYSDRGGYNGTSRVKGYREKNEDTIGCFKVSGVELGETPIYVLVVCDGMGGGVRGKYASSLTVQSIRTAVESIAEKKSSQTWLEAVAEVVSQGIYRAHSRLCDEFANVKGTSATTCTVGIIQGSQFLTLQVGDSRLYVLNQRGLHLQTEDDSWAFNQLKEGNMTEAEIKKHPNRHKITKAVGVSRGFRLQQSSVLELKVGEGILLTSDGFSEFLTKEKAKLIWSKENQLESMSRMMIGEGQKDNISAIFYMP